MESPAFFCECNTIAATFEKFEAEFFLQRVERDAQRWLRNPDFGGGFAESAAMGNLKEIFDMSVQDRHDTKNISLNNI